MIATSNQWRQARALVSHILIVIPALITEVSFLDSCESLNVTPRNTVVKHVDRKHNKKRSISRTKFYKLLPKVPRILKADERRNYGMAFINALNSGDWSSIYNCFATFCSPGFNGTYSTNLPGISMPVPKTMELRNIQEACEFIFLRGLISPDNTWRPLDNMQLRVSSSGHAILEFDAELMLTFLYGGNVVQQMLSTPSAELFPDSASRTGYESAANNATAKFAIIEEHALQSNEAMLMPLHAQNRLMVGIRIHINPKHEVCHIEYIYTFAGLR